GAAPGARRRPRSESSRGRRREPLPSLQSPGAQLLEHDRVDLLDPVDPLLQVLGTGPARERGCELAFVAEAGEAVAQPRGEPAGPLRALGAGEGRALAAPVDDPELPLVAVVVRRSQLLDHFGGRATRAQQPQSLGAVPRVRVGLRRYGADMRLGPRHDGAD